MQAHGQEAVHDHLARLKAFSADAQFETRERMLELELVDTAARGWQALVTREAPRTIAQVHAEAARELHAWREDNARAARARTRACGCAQQWRASSPAPWAAKMSTPVSQTAAVPPVTTLASAQQLGIGCGAEPQQCGDAAVRGMKRVADAAAAAALSAADEWPRVLPAPVATVYAEGPTQGVEGLAHESADQRQERHEALRRKCKLAVEEWLSARDLSDFLLNMQELLDAGHPHDDVAGLLLLQLADKLSEPEKFVSAVAKLEEV